MSFEFVKNIEKKLCWKCVQQIFLMFLMIICWVAILYHESDDIE
jgi:hypothetical protein